MSRQVVSEGSNDIRVFVRERYGSIAEKAQVDFQADCCPAPSQGSCCSPSDTVQGFDSTQGKVVLKHYEDTGVFELLPEATGLSLGCGDPVTLAGLEPGQTVLDLGSGGGIDCFLAAKVVSPTGHVIGVDMTAAMVEAARANQRKIGAENVEFRLGEIEHLPVADRDVDVIISNCVINLSPDKPQVFREAYRVLKPGGKLAVGDIVTDGPLPAEIKTSLSAWAGCIAGALDVSDYVQAIEDAGFEDVEITPTYWDSEVIDSAIGQLDPELAAKVEKSKSEGKAVLLVGEGGDRELIEVENAGNYREFDPQKAIFSAKITARKPA
jgi:arsenite methyltransferase